MLASISVPNGHNKIQHLTGICYCNAPVMVLAIPEAALTICNALAPLTAPAFLSLFPLHHPSLFHQVPGKRLNSSFLAISLDPEQLQKLRSPAFTGDCKAPVGG